jgi:hypothetical protein
MHQYSLVQIKLHSKSSTPFDECRGNKRRCGNKAATGVPIDNAHRSFVGTGTPDVTSKHATSMDKVLSKILALLTFNLIEKQRQNLSLLQSQL